MATKATIKRGRPYGQQSSYEVEHGPTLPGSTTPAYWRFGPLSVTYFHYWDVEIPAMPQLNKHCRSHREAIAYATRTVALLRAA